MALIFISGVSGTGKSTLMNELLSRGEEAHDTDTDSARLSKLTGEVLSYEAAKEEGYDWIYSKEALSGLKDLSSSKNIFLLGIPDNLQEVIDVADEFIWMSIPRNELIFRLDNRQKEYGKSEDERKRILDAYETMNERLNAQVFKLDATQQIDVIAATLLAHIADGGAV